MKHLLHSHVTHVIVLTLASSAVAGVIASHQSQGSHPTVTISKSPVHAPTRKGPQ